MLFCSCALSAEANLPKAPALSRQPRGVQPGGGQRMCEGGQSAGQPEIQAARARVNVGAPIVIKKVPLRTHFETQYWPALRLLRTSKTVDFGLQARALARCAPMDRKQQFSLGDPLGPAAHHPNGALANAVQSLRSQAVAALEKLAHLSLTQMRKRNSRPADPASLTRSLRMSREVTASQAHLCRAEVFSGRRNRESPGLRPRGRACTRTLSLRYLFLI
jgi:hypothetical protein